jgi:hypothetical protein
MNNLFMNKVYRYIKSKTDIPWGCYENESNDMIKNQRVSIINDVLLNALPEETLQQQKSENGKTWGECLDFMKAFKGEKMVPKEWWLSDFFIVEILIQWKVKFMFWMETNPLDSSDKLILRYINGFNTVHSIEALK